MARGLLLYGLNECCRSRLVAQYGDVGVSVELAQTARAVLQGVAECTGAEVRPDGHEDCGLPHGERVAIAAGLVLADVGEVGRVVAVGLPLTVHRRVGDGLAQSGDVLVLAVAVVDEQAQEACIEARSRQSVKATAARLRQHRGAGLAGEGSGGGSGAGGGGVNDGLVVARVGGELCDVGQHRSGGCGIAHVLDRARVVLSLPAARARRVRAVLYLLHDACAVGQSSPAELQTWAAVAIDVLVGRVVHGDGVVGHAERAGTVAGRGNGAARAQCIRYTGRVCVQQVGGSDGREIVAQAAARRSLSGRERGQEGEEGQTDNNEQGKGGTHLEWTKRAITVSQQERLELDGAMDESVN